VRYLLDTQIYLWFLVDSSRLSKKARSSICSAEQVFVSAASVWEAAIKQAIGKLAAEARDLVSGIKGSGFIELPVTASHAARVATLPHHHRDPFDRLLIAQAIVEPLHLLSADPALAQYSELVELA
jgi:PIN domain nuclease of toxin-antitoxin system